MLKNNSISCKHTCFLYFEFHIQLGIKTLVNLNKFWNCLDRMTFFSFLFFFFTPITWLTHSSDIPKPYSFFLVFFSSFKTYVFFLHSFLIDVHTISIDSSIFALLLMFCSSSSLIVIILSLLGSLITSLKYLSSKPSMLLFYFSILIQVSVCSGNAFGFIFFISFFFSFLRLHF